MKSITSIVALLGLLAMTSHAASPLYEIPLVDIDGNETTLAPYQGKVLLIVNVASKCGYTRQYAGLEELHAKYRDKGVVVLGFPCNQFGGQEPGTDVDIKAFCSRTFGVSFPMFSKIEVNGPDRHPLYAALAGERSPFPGKITWNFNKFLVGKDGSILARYSSNAEPMSKEIVGDIEKAL